MRNGDGFLCVYSITSKSSFEELEVFRDQILRAKDVESVIIIDSPSEKWEVRPLNPTPY